MAFPFFGRKPKQETAPSAQKQAPYLPRRHRQGQRAVARKSFDAGKTSRFSGTLPTTRMTYNQSIRTGLREMRAKSRNLFANDPYAKRYIRMLKRNVIGPDGIRLEMKAIRSDGESDQNANEQIEEAFENWGKRENCTLDQELNWREVQQLFVEMVARDGECLIRAVPNADNDFKFAIDLVSPQLIDERMERDLGNGIRIHMGVEIDRDNRRRAVYIPDQSISENTLRIGNGRYRRVSMENARLCFWSEDTGQLRGLPFIYSGITGLEQAKGFEEAVQVAARAGASKMGFIEREFSGDDATEDNSDGYEEDEDGNLIEELEPGTYERLKPGEKFTGFDPGFPNGETGPYLKSQLRRFGSSADVSYNMIGNDAEGVNYSTIRQFSLDDRDAYKMWQGFTIDGMNLFTFPRVLEFSMLTNQVRLPFRDFDRFNRPTWRPRRWTWIDPGKEQSANEKAIANGTKSRTQIAAEEGRDIADVFKELRRENDLAEEMGISLGVTGPISTEGKPDEENT